MTRIRCHLAGLVWLLAFASATAANSDWSLRTWLSEDGLPDNNVAGLAQTPDGYLWVAMPSGLARFDGNRFESFPPAAFAREYEGRRIRALLETKDGGLCIGVEPGHVIFLNHGTARIFTNGLPQQTLETLAEDGNGALWIGYRGGVVCRVKDGAATRFGTAEGVPRNSAPCSLACDNQGRLWFSKGPETGIVRDGQFKTLLTLGNADCHLTPARDGGMWICSGFQLFKYSENARPRNCGHLTDEPMHGRVNVMLEDHQGAVWIGTSANGLFRYDGSHFENIAASDREILALTEDREGNIWVGTGGGGMNRLRLRPVVWESAQTGAPFEAVQSLCEDAGGAIWATTSDGAVVRNVQGVWQTVSTNADFASVMANCVAADDEGNVWIGTGEQKLFRWHDGRFDVLGQGNGLRSRVIHGLLVSREGDLWICGNAPDAVQYLRAGVFHDISLPAGAHNLWALAEDNAGNIWTGGNRGMLLRMAGDQARDESAYTADLLKAIRCLRCFPDGSLWMGFSAGGVARLKDGKFSRVDVSQGLFISAINQIMEDTRGSVWFGSDRGIFRVREKELSAVADGAAASLWSIHYGRSEEIPSMQGRYGNAPGALRSRDGRIWIPMRDGLAIVNPAKLREDLQPPAVLVNRATVDDQTVALYGGNMPVGQLADLGRPGAVLHLPPRFNRLEFEFTALSFGPPENIHFRYQLEGLDNHWRDAGDLRSAVYSRLPAGNYRFRVTGCNSDGIWNGQGAAFAFTVAPFFWQTWTFRLAALLVFTAIVAGIVRSVLFRRLRIRLQILEQQAALDKERARIARDIHDDLGGSLTQVALLSGLATRDAKAPEKAGEHIRQISATTHQAIRSLDEIVWAVNPRNDTLPDLINYLGQFAVEFLRTAGIQCQVDLPDHPPRRPVTSEMRHHLYLAVKETLNNITRHAHAKEVRFRVDVTDSAVNFVIEDDGRGFDDAVNGAFADGVRNMRQRMEEIGGQFQVASADGKGTRVELVFFPPEK